MPVTILDQNIHSTWVVIDLDALESNIALLRARSGVPVMAVVKANAYGHGVIPVAQAALRAGAEWLAVARLEEAIILRDAQLSCPILVMGYTPQSSLCEAAANGISLTIWSNQQLDALSKIATGQDQPVKVHLKIDTGMSRLGAQSKDALSIADHITSIPNVEFEGIFTHFARADERDQTSAKNQEHEFNRVLDQVRSAGLQPTWVHAANSAASLYQPESRFNLIRPGISIYGLDPSHARPLPPEFRAALEWKAVLSQVKTLPPGRGVSYGHEYITQGEERIGTIPVGYADGFRRVRGNQVLVGGKRVSVVGRVCMDQVCVQLDKVPDAQAGDEVVIIGSQGEEHITAEEVAARWGTINYEVVCGLAARVPRIYLPGRRRKG